MTGRYRGTRCPTRYQGRYHGRYQVGALPLGASDPERPRRPSAGQQVGWGLVALVTGGILLGTLMIRKSK